MAKYRILVVPSDTFGCGKFRSIDPHIMLQKMYPDLFDITFLFKEQISYPSIPEFLNNFDLIHLHKEFDPDAVFIQICKFLGKKVILDLDDHYNLSPLHPMYGMSLKENWSGKIIKHVNYADLITTTTDIYKKLLLKNNKNVEVLPNAINPNEEQFIPKDILSEKLRIGVVCGSSHFHDLLLLNGMSSMFTEEELNRLEFVLCGFDTRGSKYILNPDGTTNSIPISPEESVWTEYEKIITNNYSIVSEEYKKFLLKYSEQINFNPEHEPYKRFWTKPVDSYATHYNNIDVLLVPLVDNEFNSVKSQLKVIEAGFFKKGIIASNFGPYTLDLKNIFNKGSIDLNGNSILIDKHKGVKEWVKAIRFLLNHKDVLEKMKDNLHDTVKDKYSLETVTKKRKELYLSLLEK